MPFVGKGQNIFSTDGVMRRPKQNWRMLSEKQERREWGASTLTEADPMPETEKEKKSSDSILEWMGIKGLSFFQVSNSLVYSCVVLKCLLSEFSSGPARFPCRKAARVSCLFPSSSRERQNSLFGPHLSWSPWSLLDKLADRVCTGTHQRMQGLTSKPAAVLAL